MPLEVIVVGDQATQESATHQMAKAPAKDVIGGGKAVVEARTSVVGSAPAPKKTIAYPKIVYPVLTPGSTALVPGAAPTSPTCGLEELRRQAEIVQGNNESFGKLLAESATNLKIIALVSFFAFCISYEYPTVAPEDVDGKTIGFCIYML